MKIPNMLTLLRIVLIPVFIVFFYIHSPIAGYLSAAVFVLAALTDIFDGQLARKMNMVSDFGKLMDPIADKMLVSAALILLASAGMIHPAIVIVIISREFLVSGLRSIAAARGIVVPASIWGKLKTIVQIVVAMLLVNLGKFVYFFVILQDITVYCALALTIISCIDYFYQYYRLHHYQQREDKK
ncbi:MAG: CDP-diacylglycerol--glycerol-3-phosphate 3-phosphatidyltransferase [Christensenellales bacterium]